VSRHSLTRSRSTGRLFPWAWILVVLGLIAFTAQEPPTADAAAEALELARQNDALEQELALAESKMFYLVVRPDEGRARLGLEGATLQEYTVSGMLVGRPRVAFWPRESAGAWEGVIWANGQLDPPREIRRPALAISGADSASPSLVPPTPEEAYPVPSRYAIEFDGGLTVDVWTAGEDWPGPFWRHGWLAMVGWALDAREALRSTEVRGIRLRLDVSREEAEALYRTLPPDVQLLIVPIGPTPAATD